MKENPEIKFLLAKVEKEYGRPIRSTSDFEALSVIIEHQVGDILSASTLKRIWGYVNDRHAPRLSTLDILCRYLNYTGFVNFCDSLKNEPQFNSAFFVVKTIQSKDLAPNAMIEIGWSPNRYLQLRYLGNSAYVVVEAANSKLIIGDRFEATIFMLGYPLYLQHVIRGEEETLPYVAGRQSGLTILNLLAE